MKELNLSDPRPSTRKVREAIKKTAVVFGWEDYVGALLNTPLENFGLAEGDALVENILLPLDAETFRCLPWETWEMFLQWSRVDKFKWVEEYRDCDDYAGFLKFQASMKFKVNGIVFLGDYSGGHAYNMLGTVKDDGSLGFTLLEPQTDGRLMVGDMNAEQQELYKMEYGFILI